jgi:tetratricopeptide (TPR) repeat protein
MKKIVIFALMAVLLMTGWYQFLVNGHSDEENYAEYAAKTTELMESGYYVEALENAEAALAIDSGSRDMLLAKAYCCYNLDKKDDFITLADDYMSLYGGDEQLYVYAAAYYEERLDYSTALRYLEKGVDEFPESSGLTSEEIKVKGECSEEYTSYTSISAYFDGYAIAKGENGCRLINESGNTADGNIQGYEEIFDFYKNDDGKIIIAVNNGGKSFYYDADGNLRLSPEENYDYLGAFRDGFALVKNAEGWFYIDEDFNVCSDIYQNASSFYNGVAAVNADGKWKLVDRDFNALSDESFDDILMNDVRVCNVAGTVIAKQGECYYAVNDSGDIISQGYEDARTYSYNGTTAAVKKDGKWGLMDTSGNLVLNTDYDELLPDGEGFAAYKAGDKWGYMDLTGQTLIEPLYDETSVFNRKGYALVSTDGTWKFLRLKTYSDTSIL